jgi:hypothetical protein
VALGPRGRERPRGKWLTIVFPVPLLRTFPPSPTMPESNFLIDFALGGVSGAVAKTCTAPIERVKLLIQTQDANPRIKSGEALARVRTLHRPLPHARMAPQGLP